MTQLEQTQSVVLDSPAAAINEVLFPVGCSLVLFASGVLAKRLPR
jgi:hypothetical protein